ncbi:galactofuranosylgalactofuranosylrhamnosyl-N-acetylglucosaminyl-diphospho-decaprenol beta-1,5/1,6-galactofuranosyltransferase [Microbacterium halimionae]|uniref:Galactofuranosylgalactofuranosylrhamnosyl-N-acetylglucosaminyl-diphospho-decaprenol beta-1,5/1,6-galactofuranosyltransferase n=1 Tax=Microbacterium halimionae TaxID=1526413 RepID=A0A7W3JPH8_9MICO|nr:glycosyltransferase [Microbacterium halimionae]MBA8816647.1 galactofuranosylgalactofuranosylrhamnosyl-N-acetylglucosaminyl-diphospho-decaprenol beta-1,5/1,6-galactofuranosyltransferase [Microbacterium halimionae]NII95166.1 galactofuranosylgalactofuranosylrhamnosyl-N-acetylglucosaminyl-diphospho-decaprenol beta-1,5/1,6-galactofuranosyltransferase [Microbacterium halimionae]
MTHVLQNVVFPLERDPDILPLYADPETWSIIDEEPVRVSSVAHLANVLDRRRARISASRRVSFASYFNAFPASYWQHWTPIRNISLTVRTTGTATVLVYRSTGGGIKQRIETHEVTGSATTTVDLVLDQYSDGGWIWFDIVADHEDTIFEGAEWTTEQEPVRAGKASLGITTYNKPGYCVETLANLAQSPEALDVIDRIFVIDQGTENVEDRPEYAGLASELGETLQVIRQHNLGGSGGFSRAMVETLDRPDSDFVQLLDDDVRIEPESIRRSVIFGRYCTTPTIVGAHMFDLLDRPKLHAWAEVVDDVPFMWRTLFQERMPHDFSEANLRQSPMLHMRLDSDYNGWWMCLIPVSVLREIGLALPAFIKWDDAEHCLRARAAGVPTVSLPGVALWHVSWVGKDDSIDWQAYFHARNRIVAALLHSPVPDGGTLIRHSRRVDLKHLMMMQYYPVELRHRALRDVMSGPQHMWKNLETAMPSARAAAKDYPETVVHKESSTVLRSRRGRQVFKRLRRQQFDSPTGMQLRWFTLSTLVAHWIHTPRPENVAQPEVEFGKMDAHWWRIPRYDSALVSTADGAGKNIYTRDRAAYRRMILESVRLHRRLRKEWPRLSREYREALPDLTSADRWREQLVTKS